MQDRKFLNRYFSTIYTKLEADALLFNKKLPHAGLCGSENEQVIADVITEFLPRKFGVETNGLVIDQHGGVSKQCDIIIYDAEEFPKYFRKVFPVELVYGVIEVKTCLTKQSADLALDNLKSLNALDFRPALTPYWETRTMKNGLMHSPPVCGVFAYRTDTSSYETFAKWFPWEFIHEGRSLRDAAPKYPEIRSLLVCALDQGTIQIDSSNGHVRRWAAGATEADAIEQQRSFEKQVCGYAVKIDPAKSLFLFLESFWVLLSQHHMHPGFDIRSYMDADLGTVIPITEQQLRCERD